MSNRKSILIIITTILFSIVVMISCTKKSNNNEVANVSFSKDILPVFEANCAINSSCHIGSYSLNDHVNLTDSMAYNTIESRGLIVVATPAASILYNQIATGIMPKAPYSKLSAAQINLVLNWIQQGAKNN